LLGVVLAGRVIYYLLRQLTRITRTPYDDQYVVTIKAQVKWFVAILALGFATNRLEMFSPEWKQSLDQLYFALYVTVITIMLWKLIDFSARRIQDRGDSRGDTEQLRSFLLLIRRASLVLLLIIAVTIVLNNYGLNVTLFVAVLGLTCLALSLAGQTILADVIGGFVILMDRPFRVGDRIEIKTHGTTGIVEAIGTRTTRIFTDDNRVIVVPNSKVGESLVINYTHPDPRLRQQIEIRMGRISRLWNASSARRCAAWRACFRGSLCGFSSENLETPA